MCKFNPKNDSRRIDPCMRNFIDRMNVVFKDLENDKMRDFTILASCCGHFRYPMTLVVSYYDKECEEIGYFDWISGKGLYKKSRKNATIINTEFRKKKFYKKDSKGYYFIPEVIEGEVGL